MKKRTKLILVIGGTLLVYGHLCRWFDLYFFWDSKSIGWMFLLIGAISYLFDNIEIRENQNKKTIWNKIGIGFLSFILIVGTIFSVSIRLFSDAYEVATNYIVTDSSLKEQLGIVNGFSIMTSGSIQTETNSEGEFGFAVFELTAKGDKKFKDLTIQLVKNPENPNWRVEQVE
jgi:hypothetical protein